MIKIYMSFPKDSIEECVKIIFDSIDKNNMSSHSKIANKIRSDSVVETKYKVCIYETTEDNLELGWKE